MQSLSGMPRVCVAGVAQFDARNWWRIFDYS